MGIDLQLFKNRNFLFYWLSGWITSLGDSIFVIALTWMLVKKTESPSIVGMYLFVLGISKMVFILVGGIIVDRMDAKKLILFSNLIRAALIFVLFFLSDSPLLTIPFFFCMAAVFGAIDAVAEPAAISCRTRIVKEEHYTQSMSLLMIAGNVSSVIGPGIGAWLVALGGTSTAILINAIAFCVAAALLLFVRFEAEEDAKVPEVKKNMWADFAEGFKYFIHTPIILIMAICAFFTNAAVGATVVSIPFLSKDLGLGVTGFGWMNTGIGIGSAMGAIIFSIFVIRNPKPYMTLMTCFLQGLTIIMMGFVHSLWMIIPLFALLGLFETAVNIIAPSVNHSIIPKKIFGRVISVMILIMSCSVPISQAAAGWLMEWTTPDHIFIMGGLLEIAAAMAVFLIPSVRNFNKNHVLNTLVP